MKHLFRQMSLQRQIGLLVVAGVLLLSLAYGALSLWSLHRSTQRVLDERLATTRLAARYLDKTLEHYLEELPTIAAALELRITDDNLHHRQVLLDLLAQEPGLNIHYVFLLDAGGVVQQTDPYRAEVVGADFAGYPVVAQVLASGQPGISDALDLDRGGPPVVMPVVPLRAADGRVTGALGSVLDLMNAQTLDYLHAVVSGQTGHAIIVDSAGTVLAGTSAKEVGRAAEHPELFAPLIRDGRDGVGTSPYLEDGVVKERHVMAFAPLAVAPWGVGLGQSEAETFAALWTTRNRFISLGLITSIIALILTQIATRRLVRPLNALTAAAQRMAAGDLSSPIAVTGAGEVGCLARSFEAMRAAVEARTRELAALNEIGQALSSLTEPAVLLQKIHELTGRVMDNRNLYIALYDEPNGQILFPLYYVDGESQEPGARPFGAGLTEHVIRSGAPLWLPRNVEDAFTELSIERIGRPCRCLLAVPMIAGDQVIGVIAVQDYENEKVYDEGHLELLSTIASQAAIAIENARLFEAEQAQLRLAQTLQHVGALLTARLGLDELFDALFDLLARVVQYDSVSIQLLTEDGTLDLVAGRGFPDLAEAKEVARRIGAQTLAQRWAEPKAVVISDTRTDPQWIHTPEMDYIRSWVGAPLLVKERLIGVLNVDSKVVNPYGKASGETIMAFANQAAVAIENARLFEAEARRGRQLALVGEIARQAAATLDAGRLLREVAEALVRTFGYYDVAIFSVDLEAGELMLEARAGELVRDAPQAMRQEISVPGIIGWVAEHGETVLANDVEREPRYRPFLPDTRAELCVPIKDGERVIGGINIESERLHAFDAVDVATIETLAAELAVALRNARLFAETRHRAQELAALFDFSAALQAAENPDDIPPLALDQAVGLTGADGGLALLFDAARRQLVPAAARNVNLPAGMRLRPEDFPAGHRLMAGQVCAVRDADPLRETCPLLWAVPDAATCWCAPLRAASDVTGVLHVHTHRPRPVQESDLRLLETAGNQAAIALEKARLAQTLRQHAARLEEEVAARTAEIRAEKERSDTILSNVGDAIAITDAEGQALYINPAFEQLTGYAAAEIIGRNLRALLRDEIPEQVYAEMGTTLGAGRVWRGEVVNRRKDGRPYDADLTIAPVLGSDGRIVNYVSSHRDITRMKELDRIKDEFVSNVSHELRTPITSLKLYRDLLATQPEKRDVYLARLQRETERLELIVENLLRLSRLDQGQVAVNPLQVDLNALVSLYVTDRQPLAERRGLSLTFAGQPDLPTVHADQALLGQVLSILLTNALNYTPSGGRVTVSTHVRPSFQKAGPSEKPAFSARPWVGFSVSDTGPGIPPDEQPRLFERFFRGKAGRESGTPGTGLGLAIVKEIVERHQGQVDVISEPGEGATFAVWLPAQ